MKSIHLNIITAKSGNEAISLLTPGNQFDLIISERLMNDCGGFNILNHLCKNNKNLPFIFFTRSKDFLIPPSPQGHFVKIVEKPNLQDLLEAISLINI